MPRTAREKSERKLYHVMLRGINRQQIFENAEDKGKFLNIVRDCKAKSQFKLYAYCLMGNHVHLLLQVEGEPLEQVIKRIGSKYVYWYNTKYQRIGHLFQDRFKSEPIEGDDYFITVIRYIHQNPIKAGLSHGLEYSYSSYSSYVNSSNSDLVDIEYPFEIFGKKDFFEFHKTVGSENCLDITEAKALHVTDEKAQSIIHRSSNTSDISEFQRLSPKVQSDAVIGAHKKGVSIRQLSRMTGISKGVIERILKQM